MPRPNIDATNRECGLNSTDKNNNCLRLTKKPQRHRSQPFSTIWPPSLPTTFPPFQITWYRKETMLSIAAIFANTKVAGNRATKDGSPTLVLWSSLPFIPTPKQRWKGMAVMHHNRPSWQPLFLHTHPYGVNCILQRKQWMCRFMRIYAI